MVDGGGGWTGVWERPTLALNAHRVTILVVRGRITNQSNHPRRALRHVWLLRTEFDKTVTSWEALNWYRYGMSLEQETTILSG